MLSESPAGDYHQIEISAAMALEPGSTQGIRIAVFNVRTVHFGGASKEIEMAYLVTVGDCELA